MKQNNSSQRPQKTILGLAPEDVDFGAAEANSQRLTQPIVSSEASRSRRPLRKAAARAGAPAARAQHTLLGGVGSLPVSVQAALGSQPAGACDAKATLVSVPTADRAGSIAARSALLPTPLEPAPLEPLRFDTAALAPASGPTPELPRDFSAADCDIERSPASFRARAPLGHDLMPARISSSAQLMELPLNRPVLAAATVATVFAIWGLAMLFFLGT